jgi:hypothetical protein
MKLYKVDFAGGGPPAYVNLEDDQVADWKKDPRVAKVAAAKQADADAAAGITAVEQAIEAGRQEAEG